MKKRQINKDIAKVIEYFRNIPDGATTLQCMMATGILRNSLTWYVQYLVGAGMLHVVRTGKDPLTGCKAKFYTARSVQRKECKQLSLFGGEEVQNGF